jgi:hypothetical protein
LISSENYSTCWYVHSNIINLVILGNEKAQLIFIDNGQLDEINVDFIEPLNRQYSDCRAQTLAQVGIIC